MDLNGLKSAAKAVRSLTIDAIEQSKSGHPGLPMGCAEIGSYLFGEVLKHNPANPGWINRDRFVLSAGHGSMLIYSLLHLSGYNLSIDDIKNFRQLHSKTPGHPEYGLTEGVETSTGPLGQGIANSVGMAIAAKRNASRFNTDKYNIFDSRIYCLSGDGCLMEGISYESCSLAGHLKLNNLILIYDRNEITIEGKIDITFTENIEKRFEAMGWAVLNIDGHDFEDIKRGFDKAEVLRIQENKPIIIIAKTIIGKGSPGKAGSPACHGAPLGGDEAIITKKSLGLDPDKKFTVDNEVYEYFNKRKKQLKSAEDKWCNNFYLWADENPNLKKQYENNFNYVFDSSIVEDFKNQVKDGAALRDSSHKILKDLTANLDFVVSGSADLGGSNKSLIKDGSHISADDYSKNNIQYGVREHAMGGIANGLYLYGGIFPIVSTFLAFATYVLPAIRMSALMEIPVSYLFSHDSLFVGEDGPTHQPVEHINTLRLIPNLNVMRPADPVETADAWRLAFSSKKTPTVILTTRQKVPYLGKIDRNPDKGAYIVYKGKGNKLDLIIFASGSEVSLSIEAAQKLESLGKNVRVVNLFSNYLFDRQTDEYKNSIVSPETAKRVAIEVGSDVFWYKFVGMKGKVIGINCFGLSGKAEDVADHFGFTLDKVVKEITEYIKM